MNKIALAIILFCYTMCSFAATNITTTTVSGHWTTAGSPYNIFNDISIPMGQSLTIDPGVDVVFHGSYSFNIAFNGYLIARGTPDKYINFKVNDTTGWSNVSTTMGSWKGIIIGGLANMPEPADTVIEYCNFSDLKGSQMGTNGRPVSFRYCNFFHNYATNWAMLTLVNDSFDISEIYKCRFCDNKATNAFNILNVYNGKTNIRESIFNNNTASNVILCANAQNLLLDKNSFYDNRQIVESGGAGTVTILQSKATIANNKIYQNTNIDCAALVCSGSFADINGNVICNNRVTKGFADNHACGALQGGGGIRLSGAGHYTVCDNVIANNHAAFQGGAIYIYQTSANIFNNHIVNNTTGGPSGGFYFGSIYMFCNILSGGRSCVRIKNNLFHNNLDFATNPGSSLLIESGDTVEYMHNWTNNITHKQDVWDWDRPYTRIGDSSDNIIGTDAMMVNPTTMAGDDIPAIHKNFALQPASPCIDKGDTTGIYTDSFDVTCHPRIYGGKIDIGAHEYGPWTASLYVPTLPQHLFDIFPNPAKSGTVANVSISNGKLELWSIAGFKIAETQATTSGIKMDLQNIAAGIYFAVWEHDGTKNIQKLVVE